MKRKTQYINTDLDLVAPFDLQPLAEAFSARGVFALHVLVRDDGAWLATLELSGFLSPEPNAVAFLDAIESLDSESRRLWAACTRREFDIGYECGDDPHPFIFTNKLTAATIARMAALQISLQITLYPVA